MTNIVTVDGFDFQYNADGYVNINNLCKPFGMKAYKLINRNSVKDYINKLQSIEPTIPIVLKQVGGKASTQGWYCKPELCLYISSLMSDELYKATQSFMKTYLKIELPSIQLNYKPLSLTVTQSSVVEVNGYSFQFRQDNYVNLTKMCKQAGKDLKRFFEQSETLERFKVLQEVLSKKVNHEQPKSDSAGLHAVDKIQLIQKRVGGTPNEQGTYGHPLVALFLAQWLSPEFAVATVQLTEAYFKADVSLATDILERAKVEDVNQQGRQLANVLIEKADPKTEAHIQARLNTKNTNRELNKALADCPNVSRAVFSMAQDAIYKATYGKAIKTLKKEKGLIKKDDSIRDTLTTRELVHLAFCESLSAEVIDNTKPSGDINCSKSVYDTSKQVKEFAANLTHKNNN